MTAIARILAALRWRRTSSAAALLARAGAAKRAAAWRAKHEAVNAQLRAFIAQRDAA